MSILNAYYTICYIYSEYFYLGYIRLLFVILLFDITFCCLFNGSTPARRGRTRGMDTYGFHPSCESPRFLLTSACQRTETIAERQSGYSSVGAHSVRPFLYLYAVPDSVLLHIRVSSTQARHKVNCPKGKRESPGGYPCRATRLRGGHGRHLRMLCNGNYLP